jgi:hypothetical protein
MSFLTWSDIISAKSGITNSEFATRQDERAMVGDHSSNPWYHLEMFNRFYLPEGFLWPGGLRGHIFFTRPDCNLMDIENKALPLREKLRGRSGFSAFIEENSNSVEGIKNAANKVAMKQLQQNTGHPSAFMPIFSNTFKGYTPEDQVLDTVEKGDTLHGIRLSYAKHSMNSRSSGTFTLNFHDTKDFPLYKTVALWTDYIEAVFLGDHSPNEYYIKTGIVDYAVAMYYVVTRDHIGPDIEASGGAISSGALEVVYWEKLLGVFPITRPDSAFATTVDQFTYPEFSIQFKYSMKSKSSVLDPYILSELNKLSALHHRKPNTVAEPTYKIGNTGWTDMGYPFVSNPIVQKYAGKYFLSWNIHESAI